MEGTCSNLRDGRPCATPLDEAGGCVTCAAEREGLMILRREAFSQIRELHTLLEEQGLDPEMERVPASKPEERHHPLWNLYVPAAQLQLAKEHLGRDRLGLLDGPEALAAVERGEAGIKVDEEGDVTCPACGHAFRLKPGATDCPDCGLSLGVPDGTEG